MTPTGVGASGRLIRLHQQAEVLADRLPPLLVAAERVAATVAQGVHGRRRVGVGDTFWQFRPYQSGDSTSRIDWRQSARSTQLFLRDQEWEAAETVWLWADASGSMAYSSTPRVPTIWPKRNFPPATAVEPEHTSGILPRTPTCSPGWL